MTADEKILTPEECELLSKLFSGHKQLTLEELRECKTIEGNHYCWDLEGRQFVQVQFAYLDVTQVPKEVIFEFMRDGLYAERKLKKQEESIHAEKT